MYMTFMEAHVPRDKWDSLKEAFKTGQTNRPAKLLGGYLVQGTDDPTLWRLVGLWPSREDLDQYRRSVQILPAQQMFRSIGIEPVLSGFDVHGQGSGTSLGHREPGF